MDYKYVSDIEWNKLLSDQVYQLLNEAEQEFVPPLHERTSTTQKDLKKRRFTEEEKTENFRSYFREMAKQRFIVAMDGDTMCGFLSFRPDEEMTIGDRSFIANYISTIVVSPKNRHKGIGTGLYKCLLRTMGHNGFYITRTWGSNHYHQMILDRLGFQMYLKTLEGRADSLGIPMPTLYYVKDFSYMSDKPCPVNPFLVERIKDYRYRHADQELRDDYAAASEYYSKAGLKRSWEEHQAAMALKDSMLHDAFLRTPRTSMVLPQETIDNLYWCNVDTVADLLQITEEELRTLSIRHNIDVDAINKYVARNGELLYRSEELTFKIQSLDVLFKRKDKWKPWTLDTLGETGRFDIYRPTLQDRWFDEFYSQYAHLDGEEKLMADYLSVKPDCPDGELPTEYVEFFRAITNLWDSYEEICIHYYLAPKCFRPSNLPENPKDLDSFTNDKFLLIWKDAIKAMVDIFERQYMFKHSSAGKFFLASDEGRLNIAEGEVGDQDFQLMLVSYVELRIDLDDVISFLRDYKPQPQKRCITEKPDPVNPWLAEVVAEYRQKRGDEYLRKRFKSFLDDYPDTSWNDFLDFVALDDKVARVPFLMTPRKDFGLSQHLTDLLNTFQVCNVADLLQITVEEMHDLLEGQDESVDTIEEFLSSNGYHLYSCKGYTYKMPVLSVDKELKEQTDTIKSVIDRTRKKLETSDEPLPARVMDAYSSLLQLEQTARKADCRLKDQLQVVIALGRLLEDHLNDLPQMAKDAPWLCERAQYLADLIHGKNHPTTAGVKEMCENINKKLKDL